MEKAIKHLAAFTGIGESVIKEALEKDTPDLLKFDGMKVLKDADMEQIKVNFQNVGKHLAEKELIEKTKLDQKLEGNFSSFDDIIKATSKKALEDAKITPDKKVSELTLQLQKVQETIATKENEINGLYSKLKNSELDSLIFSKLPSKLPGGITRNEGALLLRSGIETVIENGKIYPVNLGSKMLDDKGNPIDFETFINSKITERGWIDQPGAGNEGGKGGTHRQGDGKKIVSVADIKNFKDYDDYIEANGIKKANEKASIMILAQKNEGFKAGY